MIALLYNKLAYSINPIKCDRVVVTDKSVVLYQGEHVTGFSRDIYSLAGTTLDN